MIGNIADIMIRTEPEIYRKDITVKKKGENMIYVNALDTIYGIMKAVLLFYKKFVGYLTTIGLKITTYDPCVANKIINGNQMTVVWHFDDIKVSHDSKNIVTIMEKWLKKTYERLSEDG